MPSVPREPIKVTTSNSIEYIEACARSNQKASRHDPLTILFQAEKLPPLLTEITSTTQDVDSQAKSEALRARIARLSDQEIEQMIYASGISRLTIKCQSQGAFIAEAANFAAITGWEPMYAPPPPVGWKCGLTVSIEMSHELLNNGVPISKVMREKPVFGQFWMDMERAKYRHLYPLVWRTAQLRPGKPQVNTVPDPHDSELGQVYDEEELKYWYICLTSRNPNVQPPVPGAVRAIIQPFVKRFTEDENIPAIWILASNERARDVYGYFGFKVVDEIMVGRDEAGEGIKTWCMIYSREFVKEQ